ncbi:MAG: energy-coupling factor ABC transporter ATP-binding protein [Promethearchaeota archaeon]
MIDIKKEPIIMLHDVEYSYLDGTQALKGINLKIFKGELVGIMGKNGAGKTTLIRTLNGLIRPQQGSIYINNENIKTKTIAELSKTIGIIFQNPSHQLFSNTLEEELKYSLKNLNLSKDEIEAKVQSILEMFNLKKYKDRSPLNLSGGEMKKLAIASIICRNPEILIFDEPTLGQDSKEIHFFIEFLTGEIKRGKTIIIITHNVEFALNYLPRTILMSDGKIISDGPTKELLLNEFLVTQSSLIAPQIFEFKSALQNIGIQCNPEITTFSELVDFLSNFLINKPTEG